MFTFTFSRGLHVYVPYMWYMDHSSFWLPLPPLLNHDINSIVIFWLELLLVGFPLTFVLHICRCELKHVYWKQVNFEKKNKQTTVYLLSINCSSACECNPVLQPSLRCQFHGSNHCTPCYFNMNLMCSAVSPRWSGTEPASNCITWAFFYIDENQQLIYLFISLKAECSLADHHNNKLKDAG